MSRSTWRHVGRARATDTTTHVLNGRRLLTLTERLGEMSPHLITSRRPSPPPPPPPQSCLPPRRPIVSLEPLWWRLWNTEWGGVSFLLMTAGKIESSALAGIVYCWQPWLLISLSLLMVKNQFCRLLVLMRAVASLKPYWFICCAVSLLVVSCSDCVIEPILGKWPQKDPPPQKKKKKRKKKKKKRKL